MTQEDKQLLLADLSARLPYGVICDCLHDYHTKASAIDAEDSTVYYPYCDEWESIEYCKPYLRPMSSMTTDEEYEYYQIRKRNSDKSLSLMGCSDHLQQLLFPIIVGTESIDWLNAHHFDYRGLIEKGLAIAVTEENNPYK